MSKENDELIDTINRQAIVAEHTVSVFDDRLKELWLMTQFIEEQDNPPFLRGLGRAYRWAIQNHLIQKKRKIGLSQKEVDLLKDVSDLGKK
jgi:hypothetical protein